MISMTIFSSIKGWIAQERTIKAYRNTIYFQICLNLLTIGILLAVNWIDWKSGSMLNLPENSA